MKKKINPKKKEKKEKKKVKSVSTSIRLEWALNTVLCAV